MIFSVPWEVVKLQSSLLVENGVRSESKILVSCLLGGMREIETNLPSLTLAKERRALKASVRSRHSARIVVFLALWAADGGAADASEGTTDGGSDAE